jgi:hypothetical protein
MYRLVKYGKRLLGYWSLLSTDISLLTGLVNVWKMDELSGTRFDSRGDKDLTDVNSVSAVGGVF